MTYIYYPFSVCDGFHVMFYRSWRCVVLPRLGLYLVQSAFFAFDRWPTGLPADDIVDISRCQDRICLGIAGGAAIVQAKPLFSPRPFQTKRALSPSPDALEGKWSSSLLHSGHFPHVVIVWRVAKLSTTASSEDAQRG